MQKKSLCRIRLINWHYFENETISLNGSTLITGENTAGKSTILDAIQLILTTNTQKFNTAANDKGSRNLRGYVRCKIGTIGETYLRKKSVISHVALEFFDEKDEKYFVLGVYMASHDEESSVQCKWYIEECQFEDITFLNGDRPAGLEDFKVKGRKVNLIDQKRLAKEQFQHRLGRLEDRFFDIVPKSLAFKPMDNVKDFINKFVLSESTLDVESLRENINNLSELEELIERTNKKLTSLVCIENKYQEYIKKQKDMHINILLLSIAELDYLQESITSLKTNIQSTTQSIEIKTFASKKINEAITSLEKEKVELHIALAGNKAGQLVENAKRKLEILTEKIEEETQKSQKLAACIDTIEILLRLLSNTFKEIISKNEFMQIGSEKPLKEKLPIFEKLQSAIDSTINETKYNYNELQFSIRTIDNTMKTLQTMLQNLENKKLPYPANTLKLQKIIEETFEKRGITSKVHILCDLLEVTDSVWQNAIEGYLHTQKFYLIVEPEYYDIALDAYNNNKQNIHTAGIINTKKIKLIDSVANTSLAYVCNSENRYAKAYMYYLLGRVTRCKSVNDLENHDIAITKEGMLYQGFVARLLDTSTYKNPYIGQNAYAIQIKNAKAELLEKTAVKNELREKEAVLKKVLDANEKVNFALMATYLQAPELLAQYKKEKTEVENEIKVANNDPTYVELSFKLDECEKKKVQCSQEKSTIDNDILRMTLSQEKDEKDLRIKVDEFQIKNESFLKVADQDLKSKEEATEKYLKNTKTKTAKQIFENFSPQNAQYSKELYDILDGNKGLKALQDEYNHTFEQDFIRGTDGMNDYINEKHHLEMVDLVRFDEKLRKAKEDCEHIFRTDFLAKMKENIEKAHSEFKNLNKALKNIYYGDDEYKFVVTYDKIKESLYKMITSDSNLSDFNLWTSSFEQKYKEEMDDLFAKLTTKDDKGEKIIKEYTDYRTYLDYDIEISKKNGSRQRFSDIYREKSGSETQIPYYVAIAASFYQLYQFKTAPIRLMLLDEAFDKMDDERIASMMDFFNSLELQVILATPPSKIEVIGEKVNTILTAFRDDKKSLIAGYDYL